MDNPDSGFPNSGPNQGCRNCIHKPPIPEEIVESEKIYFKLANLTQKGMFWLAIAAFVSSLIVTSFNNNGLMNLPFNYQFNFIKTFAFIAALCSGLIGLLSLQTKNKDVWAAWRLLKTAILRYKYEENFTVADLLAAYKNAEDTIGNVTITTK